MLQDAIKTIQTCQSLYELRETWASNAEKWSQFSGPEGLELIQAKDDRKAELMPGRWIMESPILGRVSLEYDPEKPDTVLVAGVPYATAEIRKLKGGDPEVLLQAHNLKRAFDGTVA